MAQIHDTENVVRLLSNEWVADGRIMQVAFQLLHSETYLSVNRPSVTTYHADVAAFVTAHATYRYGTRCYRRALLNVGDIRQVKASEGEIRAAVDVEVELRDVHTPSQAGIFTRLQGKLRQMAILEICHLN